jgi:alkanesulfonate monooxygenase SsuD/methylene tetrahydromethanopterin reductase-like flavin-dependent oxidoreductase (luciferase family)
MSEIKFGWHMPSFPVDGSSGPAFVDQIQHTLERIHPHFDSVWVDDHLMPWAAWQPNDTPYLECLTTIAHFAALFPTLKFGSSVLCQSYRNPGVLAKTAANLQLLTKGRFIFGIGAGWMIEEYEAYNFDFPEPAVRIAQLEEAVQVVKKLWTEAPANFAGNYYQVKNAYAEPRPQPAPPLLIGGGGEKLTLRVVAKHAAIYNTVVHTPEEVRHKNAVLDEHCAAIGRDPATIRRSYQQFVRTPDELVGLRARLQPFLDAGIDHLCIGAPPEYQPSLVAAIAEEVAPLLQE